MRAGAALDVRSGQWSRRLQFQRILGAIPFASMMPFAAAAQQAANPSSVGLPEIHVIATTPVAPPARPAPATRPSGRAVAAPAAPAPAPAEATAAKPIPGAVEQDKIPSNVQTAGAPDFSYTVTPDLVQSMIRALPSVSLGDQTGNEFRPDINYRGFVASPVIGTPQGLAVYQNGVRISFRRI